MASSRIASVINELLLLGLWLCYSQFAFVLKAASLEGRHGNPAPPWPRSTACLQRLAGTDPVSLRSCLSSEREDDQDDVSPVPINK